MSRHDRWPRSSSGIEKVTDHQGWWSTSVTHDTSHIHNELSRVSPVLTHFWLTERTSPILTRFSLFNFTTVFPSYPLSSLTHTLRSVGLLINQTPGLVPVPVRPFDCSVAHAQIKLEENNRRHRISFVSFEIRVSLIWKVLLVWSWRKRRLCGFQSPWTFHLGL